MHLAEGYRRDSRYPWRPDHAPARSKPFFPLRRALATAR